MHSAFGWSMLGHFDSLHRHWQGMGVSRELGVEEFTLLEDAISPASPAHCRDIPSTGLVALLIRFLTVFGLPRFGRTAAFVAVLHCIVVIPFASIVAFLRRHLPAYALEYGKVSLRMVLVAPHVLARAWVARGDVTS